MEKRKTDHRVRLTKQIIRESLVPLMKKYPVSRISVKMLCENAGINRSTFYTHYAGVYDLLYQIQRECINELSVIISDDAFSEQTKRTVQALEQILSYAKANSELFEVLLSENGDFAFQREIMLLAQQKIIHEIQSMKNIDPGILEYLQFFIVNGVLSVVQKWLSTGMKEPVPEMAAFCSTLLYNGLSGFSVR
ncbi:MAG: TetR/AcrR family transcriptional regulator [Oscillospiraceae bacterium]|jgi:AcrR family transcriptional regulator|nr:TetR/AcrR family transcriptional regulator [Oscillospiraceae bacterium]